uniref:OSJNBa0070D17.18 protein n=1 Tax=Oryza sativa subsp. japonica TaxID=39947 RepID=Q7X735_ORYSJ|nr:OSJNBb0016B03.4 [Oryza sativa Japonica Group]CAE04967.2 OSJNBa0070D17.18 [Oryza sativa Japonica Group]
MDEVGGRWTFSRANEGYTSCGPMFKREKGKNVSGYTSSNSSFQLNPPLASRELTRAHPWSIPSMLLSSQLPLVGSQDQNQYVFDRAFATQVDELPMPEEDVPFCHDCREQGHYALNCPWVYAKEAPSFGLAGQTSLNQPPRTKSSLQPSVQRREPNGENPLNPGNCFPPSPPYHVGSRAKQVKGKKSKNQKRKAPLRTEEEVPIIPSAPTILCTDSLSKELSSMEEVVSLPDLLQAEQRAINLRRTIPSRRPLFASTSNQKGASPVNDSNMQPYHIITEPIKDDVVTRTMPAIPLQNQNE